MDEVRLRARLDITQLLPLLFAIGVSGCAFKIRSALSTSLATLTGTTVGPPSQLAFTAKSYVSIAGRSFLTPPQVTIEDASGTTTPLANDTITLTAFTDSSCTVPASGVLSGAGVATTNGVAAFPAFNYSKTGTVFLKATATASGFSRCSNVTRVINHLVALNGSNGATSACMIVPSGQVKCWGFNGTGQIGDGTTTDRLVSTLTGGAITTAVGIAMGGSHDAFGSDVCALLANGTAKCWGRLNALTPTVVTIPPNTVDLQVGAGTYCALSDQGVVKCWGDNSSGQLGDGSTTNNLTPTVPGGLGTALEMRLTNYSSCALLLGGTVSCWGAGYTSTPANLANGFANAAGLTLSGVGGSMCAPLRDGTLKCRVGNIAFVYGFFGNGGVANFAAPQTAIGVTYAVDAAASIYGACSLLDDGAVKCWGANMLGQAGVGSQVQQNTPATVPALSTVVSLAADLLGDTVCAVLSNGTAKCWGSNSNGQLALNLPLSRLTPVTVAAISGISKVVAGNNHACALNTGGNTVSCWGSNYFGQLGDGTIAERTTPVTVAGLTGTITDISAGLDFSCALNSAGAIMCWGYQGNGSLGDASTSYSWNPVPSIPPIGGVGTKTFSGPGGGSCTLITNAATCWGDADIGLGTGANVGTYYATPTNLAVTGFGNLAKIALGYGGSCAMDNTGAVKCWGSSVYVSGRGAWTGSATPLVPNPLSPNVAALDIAVGGASNAGDFVCVVLTGGTLNCWGSGSDGQLGNALNANANTPQVVSTLTTASKVAAGGRHACALVSANQVWCWGDNLQGELGINSLVNQNTPQNTGIVTASQVAAGDRFTCAVVSGGGGTVQCWGRDSSGQLGDGPTAFATSPGLVQ